MNESTARIVEDLRWMSPPQATSPVLWWVLGGAVLLLILAGLALLLLRRRKVGLPFFGSPEPHEVALKALLEAAALLNEERQLEFIKTVSQIVRVYIQGRFGLRAPHRSTEEFLREAEQSALLARPDQELLRPFLARCDLVKFARRRVALAEMQSLYDAARQFVEGTIPRKIEAPGEK